MPNWVYSILTITGSKTERQKFKKFAHTKINIFGKRQSNVLDTNKFIHYPKIYLDLDLKPKPKREIIINDKNKKRYYIKEIDGFNNGGYEWCCNNWGSKWGICQARITEENTEQLVYQFETAWSPIEPVIAKMSKMFPKLSFNCLFEEEGHNFSTYEAEWNKGRKVYEDLVPDENDDE